MPYRRHRQKQKLPIKNIFSSQDLIFYKALMK